MTRSRRKGGHGGGGGGGGHGGGDARWLVTYADLLTLLMVLFLVLWVISTIDLKKFEQFKSGLGDFGNKAASAAAPTETAESPTGDQEATSSTVQETSTTTTLAPGDPGTEEPGAGPPLDAEQLAGMVDELNAAIDDSGLDGVVDVHVEERGLVVSIGTDNVLFESGVGSLTPAGKIVIGSVAPQLAALSNNVIIEGYTDKRPLRRTGYDNWDLSVDRAVSVLKVLRDDFGFASTRLAATGYGDQHPIAEGDDEASLARNRRVELVIVAAPTDTAGDQTPNATPTATTTATTSAATTAADRH